MAAQPLTRPRARDVAEGIPIVGFTGINGAGKTLLAVESAIADMRRGRRVYSTVPISSPWGDSLPIRSLRELLELRDCTILLDEVSAVFPSSATVSLPEEVKLMLHTVRHRDNLVRWTAPEWMRADINLRIATQALVSVRPLLRKHDGSFWPRPRLLQVGVLDTSVGKVDETPTSVRRRRFVIPTRLTAWGAYDTHADTPMLGFARSQGVCPDCGGTITRPKHSKERHDALALPWYPEGGQPPALGPSRAGAEHLPGPRFEPVGVDAPAVPFDALVSGPEFTSGPALAPRE